jgi:hypothetical protein
VVNAARLYDQTIAATLGRDNLRHWLKANHKQELLEEIAWQLHNTGQTSWKIAELHKWFLALVNKREDWQNELGKNPKEIPDLLKEDLRTATFLVNEHPAAGKPEHFRFAHKSMFEFFLAKALYRAVVEQNPEKWQTAFVTPETYGFLEQLLALEPPTQNQWESIKQSSEAAPQLLAFVFGRLQRERIAKAEGRELPDCPLPNLAKGNYRGVDFTKLPYAVVGTAQPPLNMAGSDLTNAVFAGQTLRNLNLMGATLNHADVRHAVWENCVTLGIEWRNASELNLLTLETYKTSIQTGHQNSVNSVAFSPDGQRIVSGSYDNSVRVWDAVSGTQLLKLEGHQAWVWSVAFSPDGSSIISAGTEGWILWELPQANTTLDPYGILHAPDCKRVICGMSMGAIPALGVPDTVVVLDLLENKILHKHGDWWRLVRRMWWDEDGAYHSIAETALMQPWQQHE